MSVDSSAGRMLVQLKSINEEDELVRRSREASIFLTRAGMKRKEIGDSVNVEAGSAYSPGRVVVKSSLRLAASSVADSPRAPRRAMSSIRRNTVMLARDVLLRRFSRSENSSPFRLSLARGQQRFTLEEFDRLVHEINHMVAAYHQLLQSLGTNAEPISARQELTLSRQQCLRTCDTAKNCILPQLKSETHDHQQSSEVTKHASHQFIGCVNLFISEMRRCYSLLRCLPTTPRVLIEQTNGASPVAPSAPVDSSTDEELHNLTRDLKEAESILETLENAITVHFSIDPPAGGDAPVPTPRTRKKWCQLGKLCANFKTSYA